MGVETLLSLGSRCGMKYLLVLDLIDISLHGSLWQ